MCSVSTAACDRENGDLYAGVFDEASLVDPPPGARLLSVYKIRREAGDYRIPKAAVGARLLSVYKIRR